MWASSKLRGARVAQTALTQDATLTLILTLILTPTLTLKLNLTHPHPHTLPLSLQPSPSAFSPRAAGQDEPPRGWQAERGEHGGAGQIDAQS